MLIYAESEASACGIVGNGTAAIQSIREVTLDRDKDSHLSGNSLSSIRGSDNFRPLDQLLLCCRRPRWLHVLHPDSISAGVPLVIYLTNLPDVQTASLRVQAARL